METSLATSTDFQQRVFEKIRENIGQLMTDAELKSVLDVAMNKAFFEERTDFKNSNNYHTYKLPPLMVESVEKLLKTQVDNAIKGWIDEHPDEIQTLVSKVVAKGVLGLVEGYVNGLISPAFNTLRNSLAEKGISVVY